VARAGAARARGGWATGDPALEYCLGLCCERMCSDQKRFWVGGLGHSSAAAPRSASASCVGSRGRTASSSSSRCATSSAAAPPTPLAGDRAGARRLPARAPARGGRTVRLRPQRGRRQRRAPSPLPQAAQVTIDEWAAHPPVFAPAGGLSGFFASALSAHSFFGQPTARIALDAVGPAEARIHLTRVRGESRLVALVPPASAASPASSRCWWRQSPASSRPPTCVANAHFLLYPQFYRIHPRLVAVDARELVSLRTTAHPFRRAAKLGLPDRHWNDLVR
jgi:hypothetical protein